MLINRLSNRWTAPRGRSATTAPPTVPAGVASPAAAGGPLLVSERPGRLVTVVGPLDGPGVEQLAAQLAVVLTQGTAFLGLDLSGVTACDLGLFTVLAGVHARLRDRRGWLRLVGLSPAVLAAVEHAPIPEILIVYLTSDWAPGGGNGGEADEIVSCVQWSPSLASGDAPIEDRP